MWGPYDPPVQRLLRADHPCPLAQTRGIPIKVYPPQRAPDGSSRDDANAMAAHVCPDSHGDGCNLAPDRDLGRAMKIDEYLRNKERIIESYERKLAALKIIYPDEWKMDHERKASKP